MNDREFEEAAEAKFEHSVSIQGTHCFDKWSNFALLSTFFPQVKQIVVSKMTTVFSGEVNVVMAERVFLLKPLTKMRLSGTRNSGD